jgi:hypothetical protein
MASKGNLNHWKLASGGLTGSICMDASAATAIATGLQCGLIDVHTDTVFSTLAVAGRSVGTATNFLVDNGLTGVTRSAGLLWPGYGRYFTDITITSGQISRYTKQDD